MNNYLNHSQNGSWTDKLCVITTFLTSMLPLILKMEEEECEEKSEAEKIIEYETKEILNRIKYGYD